MNMWIKVIIAEALGLAVVFNIKYHFLPIYLSIPMMVVSSFIGVYALRDATNKFKENIVKQNLRGDKQ